MIPYFETELGKLYCGDSLEVLKSIDGIDFNQCIFVSDPPFNIGYHYKTYTDRLSEDEYYSFLEQVFKNYRKVIIHYPEPLYKFAFQIGEFPDKVVSWVYNSNTTKQHRDIAFFGVKPDFNKVGQPYKNPTDKRVAKRIADGKMARLYDWWEINQVKNVSKTHSHPCVMPEKVMTNIIRLLPDKLTIIDPFFGSGTTGVACELQGRRWIGIELDESYCEIAAKRIQNNRKIFDI